MNKRFFVIFLLTAAALITIPSCFAGIDFVNGWTRIVYPSGKVAWLPPDGATPLDDNGNPYKPTEADLTPPPPFLEQRGLLPMADDIYQYVPI
ncbi:hypothetical protein D6764_04760 [Candidatus Woesearchaeota archaeon]|nr:MAG: hypothetical protein D6764_04760 [Candidatus Woesearchaeota archaeon]